MVEEELGFGDDCISDDSSFYGDEDEQERLLQVCDHLNEKAFWKSHQKDLNCVLAKNRAMSPPELFNPRQGQPYSWQLGESAGDFVRRIPPLTTSGITCEWIWVENPYLRPSTKSDWPNAAEFKSRGFKMLEQTSRVRRDIQSENFRNAKGTTTRMLSEETKRLQEGIVNLAEETSILSGKWMLFPAVDDLTRVWRTVVEGVITNRLGPTAKVAPDEGNPGPRLICVYTKDFRDHEDVLRVLRELVAMGLVGSGRAIYYKSDPYTWLDIYSQNAAQYGLQASLYSSQKMLASGQSPKSQPVPQKKQSSLSRFYQSK
ncbi:hypothetical protein BDV95DRAFT_561583 [Massariosphaeria phaeospora]|uniref:DUF1917-domain-containing protein n=1 Tax=Massariosphaeria phaeospora TaxID=100035 RepID=A0A7C8MHY5_9PLEO|nr:hypothetical protein BDV95DRAFT_561583 [Massariosphaeria phaeospora]